MARKYSESRSQTEKENNKLLDYLILKFKSKMQREIQGTYEKLIDYYDEFQIINEEIINSHRIRIENLLIAIFGYSIKVGQERSIRIFKDAGWINNEDIFSIRVLGSTSKRNIIEKKARENAIYIADTTRSEIKRMIEKASE